MKVRFYNFSKEINSTRVPSATYTEKECKLKDDTSMHDPTVQIASDPTPGYTFAYIPDWDRYYFVRDQISIAKGITDVVMVEDSLASHKSEIGYTIARVAFAADSYDVNIPDTRMTVKATKTFHGEGAQDFLDSTGCYVLTVFNDDDAGAAGMSSTYVMNHATLIALKKWMTDTAWGDIGTYFNGRPLDSIFSCIWVPFPYDNSSGIFGSCTKIHIGNRSTAGLPDPITISCYQCVDYAVTQNSAQITIPWQYSDFRNMNPYTTGILYLPGVGNVELNMSDWQGSTKINITATMEYVTGNLTYILVHDNGAYIQTVTCNVAAQCPLGQMTVNTSGMVSSIKTAVAGAIGIAAGVATGGTTVAIAGAGAMLAGAAEAALAANQHAASIAGSVGGRSAGIFNDILLTLYVVETEDITAANFVAFNGRPLAQSVMLSSLSGYIQCDNAHCSIAGSDRERQEIDNFLNTGFFYE